MLRIDSVLFLISLEIRVAQWVPSWVSHPVLGLKVPLYSHPILGLKVPLGKNKALAMWPTLLELEELIWENLRLGVYFLS